jgi:hypothetical protein
MPGSYGIISVTVLPLDGTSAGLEVVPDTPATATGSGEYISQGCGVMSWHTGVRGPSGRGRTYFGPITETAQSSGLLTSDVDEWAGDGNGLLAELTVAGFHLCVASYVHSVTHDITSGTNDGVLRTQRKRNHGAT